MGAQIQIVDTDTRLELGILVSRTNNTVYQAATDGFVCAYRNSGTTLVLLADSGNPPTNARQQDNANPDGCIAAPTKKDDYWKVTGAVAQVFWIPFNVVTIKP